MPSYYNESISLTTYIIWCDEELKLIEYID